MSKPDANGPPVPKLAEPQVWAFEEYVRLAREAYMLLRGTRLGELRGHHRQRRFNEQGLEPVSVAWGQLSMLAMLLPADVAQGLEPDPVALRAAAYTDAENQFRQEVRDGAW